MPVDYTRYHENAEVKIYELAKDLTLQDLRDETNHLYDIVAGILDEASDADIVFEPYDPDAHDPHAATEAEQHIGWTLGHLVAHTTATNEEGAVFSSLLARGIEMGGRIRTETDWREIDTVDKARQRLEESRRIVLAYLDTWPDEPRLDVYRDLSEKAAKFFGKLNAQAALLSGFAHMDSHLDQFRNTLQQAKATHLEAATQ